MRNTCCICLLLFLSQGLWSHAQSGLRPRGDVNCDWEVTIADVNALTDSILVGAQYHSFYSYATDLNQDQEINIADLNLLIDALLGAELPPMPSFSRTLPVMYINTEGNRNIDSRDDYLYATWWIDAMRLAGYESIGSAEQPLGMQIKGRGNFTWTNLDKKSFRLKLMTDKGMLGMPPNRHWVLLANAEYWLGQANDALPFELGRRMGMSWNPRQVPVEVVLNGQYIGMYFLTEKIRVDKNRVNIVKQKDNETDSTLVTGGWLLEIDNYDEPGHIAFTEGNGWPFWATLHTPEQLSSVQRQYMTDFLIQADSAIYNPDKSSTEWEQYIDMDSLAIYYLIMEAVDNPESFSGSCYFHKQRGDSTKLIFGPFWDGGSSFVRYTPTYEFNQFIYDEPPAYVHQRWIAEIAKFPRFQDCVRRHWQRFYDEVYPTIDAFLDEFAAKIEIAGCYDYIRWPQYNGEGTTRRINSALKPYFHTKVEWLQSQWGEEPDTINQELGVRN